MGFRTSGTSGATGEEKRNFLGPVLREFRKARGLSAEEVAARIELGNQNFDFQVSANHLHKIERQEKPLSDVLIFAYAEALEIKAIEFFSGLEDGDNER